MIRTRVAIALMVLLATTRATHAHSGPPFPIVTDVTKGPYKLSVWTDPDATDNGMPGGQFWIVINPSATGGSIPSATRATVSVKASSSASSQTGLVAQTEPVRGDVGNQFGAVLMDHEGPFAVHVDVTGPLGPASLDTMVDATYDLRPPPYMLAVYLMPFVLAGLLWTRLLLKRRGVRS